VRGVEITPGIFAEKTMFLTAFRLCTALLPLAVFSQKTPALAYLPGGTFFMGDSLHDADERPVHPVQISPFFIGKYEVTVREFADFVAATDYRSDAERNDGSYAWDATGWNKKAAAHWRTDESARPLPDSAYRRPVAHVSWFDAAHYCNWLSRRDTLLPVYSIRGDTVTTNFAANGYRLPTEAEWEYAAAGGFPQKKWRYAGSDDLRGVAWFSNNSARKLHPVGQKSPNKAGLFDLCGNVWEWCHDWYASRTYAAGDSAVDPSGPALGSLRALRGGSMSNNASHCRITNRSSRYPDYRDCNVGFRVARRR